MKRGGGNSKQMLRQIFRGKIDEKSEQLDICTNPIKKKLPLLFVSISAYIFLFKLGVNILSFSRA